MGIYDLTLLFLGTLAICLLFLKLDITRPKVLISFMLSLGLYLGIFFSVHHHINKTCVILADESLADVRGLISSWGYAAPLLSVIMMTLQAVIAPLPSFLITAANGLVFGVIWGSVISWVGAMLGALVSFMMSRLFYKSISGKVHSHKKGIQYIDRLSSRYGFRVVLTARLLPFISFDLISYAAGLSSMKVRSFIIATGIGMLPGTIVYTVFGSEMGRLKEYSELLFTYSVLAVLVLIFIWTVQGIYKQKRKALIK